MRSESIIAPLVAMFVGLLLATVPGGPASAFDVLEYYSGEFKKRPETCHVRSYKWRRGVAYDLKIRPARYRWRHERIMVKPPRKIKVHVAGGRGYYRTTPAVYRDVKRRILVAPARKRAIRLTKPGYYPEPVEVARRPDQHYKFGRCWPAY